jgi:hypothetical protein
MHENVVYADIETFFGALEDDGTVRTNTKAYGENRAIASIGMHTVGRQGLVIPEEFQAQLFINDGRCDPFVEFIRRLLKLCVYWRHCRRNIKPAFATPEQKEAHEMAMYCQHCQAPFSRFAVKCLDHNHYTGEYRSTLCDSCNCKARTPTELRVFTHNGTGYDHHFYVLGLAHIMSMDLSLRDFVDAPAAWYEDTALGRQDEIPLNTMNLSVLAQSKEKFRSIKFGRGDVQILFLDSFKFLNKSLEKLIDSQAKSCKHDLSSGFRNMIMHHPYIN